MTHQQALDLMMHDSFQTQAEADGKLLRAKLSSTQLPTYFLDDRQWWTLRKKYEAAKGSAFTLEEFHDRALDQGPLPLEYLEKIILPHKQTEPFRRWVSRRPMHSVFLHLRYPIQLRPPLPAQILYLVF